MILLLIFAMIHGKSNLSFAANINIVAISLNNANEQKTLTWEVTSPFSARVKPDNEILILFRYQYSKSLQIIQRSVNEV